MVNHPIDTTPFDHLYPFKSNFLKIDGLNYHYLDQGRGEPMLMVHGNPTWSFYFRSLVSAFSTSHRIIVPDHMGCGLSDKPDPTQYDFRLQNRVSDLTRLMDHLNLSQPVTLIVHDWGGMIGLAWAMDHLDQVARIVITNTAGFFPPQGKAIPWRLRLIRRPNPIMDWMVLHLNLFSRAALHMAPKHPLSAAVKAGLTAPYNTPNNRLATLKFVQDIPLDRHDPSGAIVEQVQQHLDQLGQKPAMILWGAHDFVFDKDYFREWQRRWPGAEAHWFDDAGHYLLEDLPEKIIFHIKAFLHKYPVQ
jgi:cis-3-alkyl-4-acyloxetan-2-one decarboxylase